MPPNRNRADEITDQPAKSGKTYADGSAKDLDEASDPETFEDETKTTLRERAADSWARTIAVSSVAFIALILFLYFASDIAPGIVTNPWVQRGTFVAVLIFIVFVWATKRILGLLERYDWLVEHRPGGVKVYLGEFHQEDLSFTPHRGFKLWGAISDPYAIEDLGDQFATYVSERGSDPENPARLQLLPAFTRKSSTWLGTVVSVKTDGHAPNYQANDHAIRLTPPSDSIDDEVQQLAKEIEKLNEKIREKDERIDTIRQERNEYQLQAKQTEREAESRVLNIIRGAGEAFDGRRKVSKEENNRGGRVSPEKLGLDFDEN